ncbi:MAG: hypothetical protein LBT97_03130 [Planctomycetota bacterium]|nr:hypothetical protein [Planctomycetota bacterium]
MSNELQDRIYRYISSELAPPYDCHWHLYNVYDRVESDVRDCICTEVDTRVRDELFPVVQPIECVVLEEGGRA